MSDVELLSETPEWSDVQPLPVPEDARAAVNIRYSEEYEDTFGLLYACIQAGERSERALRLTEKCITLSPSHYTVWQHRFQCLVETNADMDEEWNLCMAIANSNAKNYQLWNHRRKCALRMGPGNAEREMEFAAAGLEIDAKNYHIWAHRQTLVAAFGLWKQEWAYAEKMTLEDPRNNSSWNQRAWLLGKSLAARLQRSNANSPGSLQHTPDQALLEDPDDKQPRFLTGSIRDWLAREAQYVKDHVTSMPHNESAWNYLVGLREVACDVLRLNYAAGRQLSKKQQADLKAAMRQLYDQAFNIAIAAASVHPACVPARAALFKLYLAAAEAPASGGAGAEACCQVAEHADRERARAAVRGLKDALVSMDPIHAGWYRAAAARVGAD
eukprot:jgi/Ulvmu1/8380/UM042_0087.1